MIIKNNTLKNKIFLIIIICLISVLGVFVFVDPFIVNSGDESKTAYAIADHRMKRFKSADSYEIKDAEIKDGKVCFTVSIEFKDEYTSDPEINEIIYRKLDPVKAETSFFHIGKIYSAKGLEFIYDYSAETTEFSRTGN